MMINEIVIGADLGGTKIRVGRIEGQEVVKKTYRRISSNEDQETILEEIIETIEQVFSKGVAAIGIGVPSIVDLEKGIVYDVENIPSWKEVHLKEILEEKFGVPVFINNDANCFALGEHHYGKGQGYRNLVGLTIGTGIGAGIIIDNKLYSGVNCGAGEIGAFPYRDKWIEYYCSGQFFKNVYHEDGRELFKKAEKGDPKSREILREFGFHLGEALKLVLHAYDPEIIILGGSIIASYKYFRESMFQSLETFNFKRVLRRLRIELTEGPEISILGAAALYFDAKLERERF